MKSAHLILLVVIVLAVLLAPAIASACPGCKGALGSNGEGRVQGFFWSIIMMMAAPFVIIGGFAYLMWRSMRNSTQAVVVAVTSDAALPPPLAPAAGHAR